MQAKSCTIAPRRLIESYYEHETGTTFVRHPFHDDEWVEHSIFSEALKGVPVPSSSGIELCEIHSVMPHARQKPKAAPRRVKIKLTNVGSCHITSGM